VPSRSEWSDPPGQADKSPNHPQRVPCVPWEDPPMPTDRRAAALALAEDLLSDIELTRLPPVALVRKASRLARLLDDIDATQWLAFELDGFSEPSSGKMSQGAATAAKRSGRGVFDEEAGTTKYWTSPLGALQANVDAARVQIMAAADAPVSVSSSNPNQYVAAPSGNTRERSTMTQVIMRDQALIEKVIGAVHRYVSEKELELRFGAAVETAFGQLRAAVDAKIAEVVPTAAIRLSAAFENAASDNSENWASAAATCRRLIKDLADSLRPPGPDVKGRKMGEDQYINRLIDWIGSAGIPTGSTAADVVVSDLEYLGRRLDALADAGHKGAHSDVSRYEASRFITGAYLLLADILAMRPTPGGDQDAPGPVEVAAGDGA